MIEDILLFEARRPFVARLLDESARTLRARGFIADATVDAARLRPATNRSTSTCAFATRGRSRLDLKLNRSGGETEWGIGLSDDNLFGTGKELTVSLLERVDRDETYSSYGDDNVLDSRVRLGAVLANASDGHRRSIAVERPFYSLDTRWALGGIVRDEQRVDTMYDLGEEIDEFRHDIDGISLARRLVARPRRRSRERWLFGVTSEEHTFLPTPARRRRRCCCRRTASSFIRGSAGSSSKKTSAK